MPAITKAARDARSDLFHAKLRELEQSLSGYYDPVDPRYQEKREAFLVWFEGINERLYQRERHLELSVQAKLAAARKKENKNNASSNANSRNG